MVIIDFSKSFDAHPRSRAFLHAEEIIVAHNIAEVMPALERITRATDAGKYAAGFVSYEAAAAFDDALVIHDKSALPLLWFGIYREPEPVPSAGLAMYNVDEWQPDTSREHYAKSIREIREHIRNGDIYQANFTLRLHTQFSGDAFAWYEDLRRGAHARFNAFVDIGSHRILSLSPELFFSWNGGTLRTRPMKGTTKRTHEPVRESGAWSTWKENDDRLAHALQTSEKNRAENLMIVDLLRNDVSRVAKEGTVRVPQLFTLESYPTVYQMTSTVSAETREGISVLDIFKALFPCGSITGAPKVKASEIIRAQESTARGVYCGAIGVISPNVPNETRAVFNVAIRTIVIDAETGRAECGVGGGIVWDSQMRDEHAEAMAKSAFMADGSHGFELLETLRLDADEYAWLDQHLARLRRSADALGFEANDAKVRAALTAHARAHPHETRRVRLTLARDGAIAVASETLSDTQKPQWTAPNSSTGAVSEGIVSANPAKKIVLASHAVDHADRALQHKTTRRSVYDAHRSWMEQVHPDAFDVLLWNEKNELTEFTYGNVVLQLDGELCTPPLPSGLLNGVLREVLIVEGAIVERVLHKTDLQRATSVWFINSVRGWVRVSLSHQRAVFDQLQRPPRTKSHEH
jgi:para-aminobenzoate synthetase / 4-amino-4-deoxychorismate lyase